SARCAQDVSRPNNRVPHLTYSPARGNLPHVAGLDRGAGRAGGSRPARLSPGGGGADRDDRRGAKMKTSGATVSLSGDLRAKLAAIAAAGFESAGAFGDEFRAFDGTPAEVGAMIRDHGLEITLFQPFRDFEGLPEPQRSRAFDRAERKFDLMQELGTDLMLVCSNVSPAALGGIDRAAADFRELGERAAKR